MVPAMSLEMNAPESAPLRPLSSMSTSSGRSSSSTNDASSESSDYEWQDHTRLNAEKGTLLTGRANQITWLKWCQQSPRRRHSLLASISPFGRKRRSCQVRVLQVIILAPWIISLISIWYGLALPSYTYPPEHYNQLRKRVECADALGRANIHNEKIFIAASIYEDHGELLLGDWGNNVRELIDILGPDNVFLSIYENDPDEQTRRAMKRFPGLITCNNTIIHEHLDLTQLPHATTSTGESKLKRIALLAEVRNRALRPLHDPASPADSVRFDKLLYLNDVVFDPIDAANLIFSTNMNLATTRSDYLAACAVDFVNSWKFYDTFATRDTEGYRMGIPIYPWFTASGSGESRNAVLAQRDNVPVKSCWGGMVAFQAKWFQPHAHREEPPSSHARSNSSTLPLSNTTPALRFRFEPDTYWDASECCLINADLAQLATPQDSTPAIYMNPYIRVAYTTSTLRWLAFTRRFERPFQWVQRLLNALVRLPSYNPCRTQQPGELLVNQRWVRDDQIRESARAGNTSAGFHAVLQNIDRLAMPGMFCGDDKLRFIHEKPEAGQARWGIESAQWAAQAGLRRKR